MNLRPCIHAGIAALLALQVACTSKEGGDGTCRPDERSCAGSCINPLVDPLHCGSCGAACAAAEVCSAGSCIPACPEDERLCDGGCVDLLEDPKHCGGCDQACAAEEVCAAGTCTAPSPSCDEGLARCGEACVDTRSSTAHCGGCDAACEGGSLCQGGACACPAGQLACEGLCVEEGPENCGACGTACNASQSCVEGVCVCPGAGLACGGGCVDALSDAENCGDCGVVCEGGERVLASVCAAGVCELSCESDFDNCDGDPSNGCESRLLSDAANCGMCGVDCASRPNAVGAACVAGNCSFACADGWGNCDIDPANGCETDLTDTPEACGSCGNNCRDLANVDQVACVQRSCELLSCKDGWDDCDDVLTNGCEIDLRTHRHNCGACGKSCTILCGEASCLDVVQLALGYGHSCALLSNGRVACWGAGSAGLLGIGQEEDRYHPVLLGIERVVEIAAGESHTCALDADGEVWCWGANWQRQLGHAHSNTSLTPVYVGGLPKIVSIGTGEGHSCAVAEDGSVWCWGRNEWGEIGMDPTALKAQPSPVQVSGVTGAVRVKGGRYHSCATTAAGTLFCWGWNASGQLGNGNQTERFTAADTGLTGVKDFATGLAHTCALLEGGQVRCVGYNEFGQLSTSAPPLHQLAWVDFQAGSEVSKVRAGLNATCVLAAGKVWCAGRNDFGILGRPLSLAQSAVPLEIEGLPPLVDFSMGVSHACGRSDEGEIWCWGFNANGQLAIGSAPAVGGDFMREVPGLALWGPQE